MVLNDTNNNINTNMIGITDDITKHPFVIIGLALTCVSIIVYIIYIYAIANKPKKGFTYYSDDLMKMDNIFSETVQNVTECQTLCEEQPRCRGITYESDKNICIGQEFGRLRTDEDNFYAWVKPRTVDTIFNSSDQRLKSGKSIATYLKSSSRATLGSGQIAIPPLIDQFSFSFWIVIQDWYQNFSYWRHIFHKGSQIDKSENKHFKTLVYYSWEKLNNDLPEQTIGAWLTPFQNNLRIAITTTTMRPFKRTYQHAHIKKCKCDTTHKNCQCWTTDQTNDPMHKEDSELDKKEFSHLEYFDIQDLPTNIPTNIIISVKGSIMNIYMNGKLNNTYILTGKPKWNNGDLYVHNPKTYTGSLQEFTYFPASLELDLVKVLYNQGLKTTTNK